MRKSSMLMTAVGLAAFLASAAAAGTLVGATFTTSALGQTATFQAGPGAGGASTATTATLAAGSAFYGTTTFTGVPVVSTVHIFISSNGKLTAHAGGAVSTTAPLTGFALAGKLSAPILGVPISVGPAGSTTFNSQGGPARATLIQTGWHPSPVAKTGFFTSQNVPQATGTVLSTTPSGKQRIRVATTGSFNLTPNGAGSVKLVTLTEFKFTSAISLSIHSVAPSSLTLTYAAPEPGTLLLLGAGIVGMLAAGRRKRA